MPNIYANIMQEKTRKGCDSNRIFGAPNYTAFFNPMEILSFAFQWIWSKTYPGKLSLETRNEVKYRTNQEIKI